MPLRVEKLFQEYNSPGAFAVASVLTLLALVTLVAKVALERFHERGKGATLGDAARMLEIASKLGRLSSGLSEKPEATEEGRPIRIEVTLALEKIYGEPLPGEVVDVEAKPLPEKA